VLIIYFFYLYVRELEEYNLLSIFCIKNRVAGKFVECLKQIDIRSEEGVVLTIEKMVNFNLMTNISIKQVIGLINQFTQIILFIENSIKAENLIEEGSTSKIIEIDVKLKTKKMEQCVYM